jgi:outer membrane lipoprotein-sorting protein
MRTSLSSILVCSLLLACASIAQSGGDDGRALVQKAIQAAGGEAKLARFHTATYTDMGTFYGMGDGIPYTGKYAINRPSQYRMEIEGVFTMVLNGDKGWIQAGGNTKEMTKEQIDVERFNHKAGWITTLVPLKDKAFTIKTAGSAKVGDREARVVEVSRTDYPTVKLSFDKMTDLLIRSEYRTKAADLEFKEVVMESTYSDFRDIDGAKILHKIVIKRDGQRYVETELSNMKPADSLDAKTFARPAD